MHSSVPLVSERKVVANVEPSTGTPTVDIADQSLLWGYKTDESVSWGNGYMLPRDNGIVDTDEKTSFSPVLSAVLPLLNHLLCLSITANHGMDTQELGYHVEIEYRFASSGSCAQKKRH